MHDKDKLEPGERPKYRSFAVVTGTGQFPFDMLRYDRCFPWEEQDSGKMGYFPGTGLGDPRSLVVARLHVDADPHWTPDRWKSFGWTLVPIAPYKVPEFSRTSANG